MNLGKEKKKKTPAERFQAKVEELVARNQELMQKKEKITVQQREIKAEIDALATEEKVRRALAEIPESQRANFIQGVTAVARAEAKEGRV